MCTNLTGMSLNGAITYTPPRDVSAGLPWSAIHRNHSYLQLFTRVPTGGRIITEELVVLMGLGMELEPSCGRKTPLIVACLTTLSII